MFLFCSGVIVGMVLVVGIAIWNTRNDDVLDDYDLGYREGYDDGYSDCKYGRGRQ